MVAETGLEARQQLRGEVDLGHQHQHLGLRVARQRGLGGAQVDLGLAAAGGAEQQEGAGFMLDFSQSPLLVAGERYAF